MHPEDSSTSSPLPPRRLDWIVRLRGIAALSVFAFHLWFYLGRDDWNVPLWADFEVPFGWLFAAGNEGVSLFFVLSGFVIGWPYIISGQQRVPIRQVADFYQRRLLRIAPVYYVSLAVAVLLSLWGWARPANGYTILLHLLFAQNFDPIAVTAINGVYWTLPTEMHFYLLFPLLLRWAPLDRPLLIAVVGLAAALTYRWLTVWSGAHGLFLTWTAGYLPGRIDQFAVGFAAACAVAKAFRSGFSGSLARVVYAAVAAVIVAIIVTRPPADPLGWQFLFGPALTATAFAATLYYMGVWFVRPDAPRQRPTIQSRLLYQIGLSSLSVYVWHTWFLDVTAQWLRDAGVPFSWRVCALVGTVPVTLAFSWLTYYWIERPFIEWSKSKRWRDLMTGTAASRSGDGSGMRTG